MQNEELIKALRCCGTVTEPCRECPYGQGEGCGVDNLDLSAADALEAADKQMGKLSTDLADCINELCLKCGKYHTAHLGSCDGCRWRA